MSKAQDDPNAVEMPDFTPEQIDYLLARAHQQTLDALQVAGLTAPAKTGNGRGTRKAASVRYLQAAAHYAQELGFAFNALGIWYEFPAGMLIACMRGDDPWAEVHVSKSTHIARNNQLPSESHLVSLDQEHTV